MIVFSHFKDWKYFAIIVQDTETASGPRYLSSRQIDKEQIHAWEGGWRWERGWVVWWGGVGSVIPLAGGQSSQRRLADERFAQERLVMKNVGARSTALERLEELWKDGPPPWPEQLDQCWTMKALAVQRRRGNGDLQRHDHLPTCSLDSLKPHRHC